MTRSATNASNCGKYTFNIVRYFGRILCFSTLVANVCLAGSDQQPIHLNQLKLGGTLAAALAPDGSRVAAITSEGLDGEWSGKAFDVLQIWDYRAEKLLIERKVNSWNVSRENPILVAESNFAKSLAYTPDGRQLVYCDGKVIHIFDVSEYAEVRAFSVTPEKAEKQEWQVQSMSLSPNGKEIAVRLMESKWENNSFWPTSRLLVSLYSSSTGALEYQREFDAAMGSIGEGLAWSPDGLQVATILYPSEGTSSAPNFADLQIFGISRKDPLSIHTEHLAGDVLFLGNARVLTVSSMPAFGSGKKDSLRLWDIQKGKLEREIPSAPDGVHYHLKLSQDGRVVLGYVGRDRRNENFVDTVEQKFRLWDAASWSVVLTSPPIPGPLDARNIRFALSATGNVIMVWWQNVKGPIYVYERQ